MKKIVLRNPDYWDPFGTLAAWLSEEPRPANDPVFAPRFDVKEDPGAYVLSADLPGVKREDIAVSLDGDHLKISGHRESSHKSESERTRLSEIRYGSFSREFRLPETVDGEQVKADLKDGVLTLVLPKKPEAQPRKIAVNAS
ncbi:MAG: Hsp20/alpha crystallin family protein [Deltaproteobacteria bacterium]|jgi:HSP20 family protein|nr:Hsp20/alpha crystallin family protein [Deltaproteobacteria bacterium]